MLNSRDYQKIGQSIDSVFSRTARRIKVVCVAVLFAVMVAAALGLLLSWLIHFGVMVTRPVIAPNNGSDSTSILDHWFTPSQSPCDVLPSETPSKTPQYNIVTVRDFEKGTVEVYASVKGTGYVFVSTGTDQTTHLQSTDLRFENIARLESKAKAEADRGIRLVTSPAPMNPHPRRPRVVPAPSPPHPRHK